jgi:hypothetical protein
MTQVKNWNFFTLLTVIFVIIMPFYVLLKVFFEHKLGVTNFWIFIKELLIIILWITVIFEFIRNKIIPKIDILDILVLAFIGYGVWITMYLNLWLEYIIYGWRYDFVFLCILLLYKHWAQFLKISWQEVIKYFLISASISLFFWIMVKFLFKESRLIFFGFSDYASNWTFSGSVPTHHWLENSGIKRFQWILEGPNAMGYFLIVYAALVLHIQKVKLQFQNVAFLVLVLWMIIMTYSRSALLWIWVAWASLFLLNIKFIYYRLKKHILPIVISVLIIVSGLWYVFQDKIYSAVIRPGSTTGHFERMEIGILRFQLQPLGSWLATSWPAFRNVYPEKTTREDEEFYIPESWFIQILTEWWVVYFSLFILIFLTLLLKTYKKSPMIFGALIAVIIMNIFLHIFESTHLTYAFFLILGIIVYENKKTLQKKK